ncbi:MAG: pilin [Neptuniibacter sp.]
MPAYQDYTIRSKHSEAATLVGGNKLAVEEYFHTESTLPTAPASLALFGWSGSLAGSHLGEVTFSIQTGVSNAIRASFSQIDGTGTTDYVEFVPNTDYGNISWDIYCDNASNNILLKHCPAR